MSEIYSDVMLANPQGYNGQMPSGANLLIVQNMSGWSFTVESQSGSTMILPMSNSNVPLNPGEYFSFVPGVLTNVVPTGISPTVMVRYVNASNPAFSQQSQLPAYKTLVNVDGTVVIDSSSPINVTGPVTVPDGVDVSNFPATFNVTTASGDTVTIAGTINIASDQLVGISGVATVEFNGTQDVNLSASDITLDTNIANVKLATNDLIESNLASIAISSLGSGDSFTASGVLSWPLGYYSVVSINVNCANANTYEVALNMNASFGNGITENNYTNSSESPLWNVSQSGIQFFDRWEFPGVPLNRSDVIIKNTGTSSVASDTVYIQIVLQPANMIIGNPGTNPANVLQPATAYNPVTNGSIATGGTSQVMVGSNANRKFLQIWNTSSTDILWVQMGQASGVNSGFPIGPGFMFQFPNPQPSNEIYIYGATTGDTYAYSEG